MKHTKILTIILLIIISSTCTFATIKPTDITGSDFDVDLGFIDNIENLFRTIGIFLAVGILMVIAIKYMTASIEEKANYKKSMMPYVIGCFILFGASTLAPEVIGLFKDLGEDTETIGNRILGIIQMVGTLIAVGVVMILGIKYMMGSVEEKAEYKRNMVPYVIGAILLFAAVNVTTVVYDLTAKATINVTKQKEEYDSGYGKGNAVLEKFKGLSFEEQVEKFKSELEATTRLYESAKNYDPESYNTKYYEGYLEGLKKYAEEAGIPY